jgi:glycolate oxidase
MGTAAQLTETLTEGIPAPRVLTDPDVMAAYASDQCHLTGCGRPAAVVLAASREEVVHVVKTASAARVPLVPRGAGSGLAGGANALDGCIVCSLEGMDRIIDIDVERGLAVVEPGVVTKTLKDAAAARGLAYPPDPASAAFCTMGGNIATNSGGLCCVKYGVTADYVARLEVVLADGSVLRTGRETVKGVAGYDLTRLFVGSEGTLGVVTEITVRLVPAAGAPAAFVATFADFASAGKALEALRASAVRPSLLEVMDQRTVCAVDDWRRMGLDRDAAMLLLGECDSAGDRAASEAEAMAAVCSAAGATFVVHSSEPWQREQLLEARRQAFPALERLGTALLDDVAVPVSRITDFMQALPGFAQRFAVPIAVFGHAGDGNLHPTIVYDRADEQVAARAREAFDAIVALALKLGGTVTGEHGVGSLKVAHLAEEIGETGVAVHRKLKHALDPLGILNPGKVMESL